MLCVLAVVVGNPQESTLHMFEVTIAPKQSSTVTPVSVQQNAVFLVTAAFAQEVV